MQPQCKGSYLPAARCRPEQTVLKATLPPSVVKRGAPIECEFCEAGLSRQLGGRSERQRTEVAAKQVCAREAEDRPRGQKNRLAGNVSLFLRCVPRMDYIIGPCIGGVGGTGSGMSAITHSVVRNIPATEAAFWRAIRATLVGSMTPAS